MVKGERKKGERKGREEAKEEEASKIFPLMAANQVRRPTKGLAFDGIGLETCVK